MTSQDSNNYVTVDVFNAHMARMEALLERNLAITRADIAEFKSEIKADIKSMNTRIDDLVHWNYWMIAFIVAMFMIPSVIEGVKSFFGALTRGLVRMFERKEKTS